MARSSSKISKLFGTNNSSGMVQTALVLGVIVLFLCLCVSIYYYRKCRTECRTLESFNTNVSTEEKDLKKARLYKSRFTLNWLKSRGFSVSNDEYPIIQQPNVRYTVPRFAHSTGGESSVSLKALKAVGYSAEELNEVGFSLEQIQAVSKSSTEEEDLERARQYKATSTLNLMKSKGFSVSYNKYPMNDGVRYTVPRFIPSSGGTGVSLWSLVVAGFSPKELSDVGFSFEELKAVGYFVNDELKEVEESEREEKARIAEEKRQFRLAKIGQLNNNNNTITTTEYSELGNLEKRHLRYLLINEERAYGTPDDDIWNSFAIHKISIYEEWNKNGQFTYSPYDYNSFVHDVKTACNENLIIRSVITGTEPGVIERLGLSPDSTEAQNIAEQLKQKGCNVAPDFRFPDKEFDETDTFNNFKFSPEAKNIIIKYKNYIGPGMTEFQLHFHLHVRGNNSNSSTTTTATTATTAITTNNSQQFTPNSKLDCPGAEYNLDVFTDGSKSVNECKKACINEQECTGISYYTPLNWCITKQKTHDCDLIKSKWDYYHRN